MTGPDEITAGYEDHDRMAAWIEQTKDHLKRMSYEFEDFEEDDAHIKGPGAYIAFVGGNDISDVAITMSDSHWDQEDAVDYIDEDPDAFYDELCEVAHGEDDGAIVVWPDGKIDGRMVNFDTYRPEGEDAPVYKEGMGSRHMSAVEISSRDDVVQTLCLSEEEGSVTTYADGKEREFFSRADIVEEFEDD